MVTDKSHVLQNCEKKYERLSHKYEFLQILPTTFNHIINITHFRKITNETKILKNMIKYFIPNLTTI